MGSLIAPDCLCGCGKPVPPATYRRPRLYFSAACRKRAHVRRKKGLNPGPEVEIPRHPLLDPVGSLAKWARETLVVPPGHPRSGSRMGLPKFGRSFIADALKPSTMEALLCVARKNAKSAIVAVLCLGYLVGPLRSVGFRAGVGSVTKAKARELTRQVEAIAEASGLSPQLTFRRTPWPGSIESSSGVIEIFSADSAGGHSASLDLAIMDEIGLLSERSREFVASMRAATSAKGGRFLALSIHGSGPFIPETLDRRDDPGVVVHHYAASADAELGDVDQWRKANPGLGTIKSVPYMEHESRRAAKTPADEIFFRAQDLNIPGNPSAEMICGPSDWSACAGDLPDRDGTCVVGFDLGGSSSMTAAVVYWPGCGRLEAFGGFPTVPDLRVRQKRDGLRYDLMVKGGELQLFDGRVTNVGRFLRSVADRIGGQRVIAAGADRFRRSEAEQALADAGVRWPMHWRGTGASATADGSHDVRAFQRKVLNREIVHNGGLLMTSAIAGAVLRFDGAGNPALDKSNGLARIDPLSAGVIAAGLAETMASRPTVRWRYAGAV